MNMPNECLTYFMNRTLDGFSQSILTDLGISFFVKKRGIYLLLEIF